MRKITIPALVTCLLVIQPLRAENLLEIYKTALENDPTYLAAYADYQAVVESKNQSVAPLLPNLNLSGSYDRAKQKYSDLGTYDFDETVYSLDLTQAIFRYDYWVALREANLQVAQAEANFRNARQDLILRVTQRYLEVLAAGDNLTFARSEMEAIGEQLNQTKQRYEVGLSAITDVHEAKARYDQAVAQNIEAENLLANTKENLREVTGQYYEHLAILSEKSPLVAPNPQDVDAWLDVAKERSLSLIAAEKAMQIAKEEISRNRAGHYPTLDLVASYSSREVDAGDAPLTPITGRTIDLTRVGVQLNLPLYEGGRVSSLTREAAHRYQQAKDLYEQQRRATERDTRSSYLNVLANISSVKAFATALESTKTALQATEAGYEVGTRTAVDVLNSRRDVFSAERDYARSRYTYIQQTMRLRAAVGTLSEREIAAINKWLK
ncbi:MAG: TolC family outer membrane protein [Thiohalomonadales bacterium]|nr:TolC family outer membrane protein [Thiohalomonadales bacterium]